MADRAGGESNARTHRKTDDLVIHDLGGWRIFESCEAANVAQIAPHEILREFERAQARERLSDELECTRRWPGDVVELELLYAGGNVWGVIES